jgi:hypothetical protein
VIDVFEHSDSTDKEINVCSVNVPVYVQRQAVCLIKWVSEL